MLVALVVLSSVPLLSILPAGTLTLCCDRRPALLQHTDPPSHSYLPLTLALLPAAVPLLILLLSELNWLPSQFAVVSLALPWEELMFLMFSSVSWVVLAAMFYVDLRPTTLPKSILFFVIINFLCNFLLFLGQFASPEIMQSYTPSVALSASVSLQALVSMFLLGMFMYRYCKCSMRPKDEEDPLNNSFFSIIRADASILGRIPEAFKSLRRTKRSRSSPWEKFLPKDKSPEKSPSGREEDSIQHESLIPGDDVSVPVSAESSAGIYIGTPTVPIGAKSFTEVKVTQVVEFRTYSGGHKFSLTSFMSPVSSTDRILDTRFLKLEVQFFESSPSEACWTSWKRFPEYLQLQTVLETVFPDVSKIPRIPEISVITVEQFQKLRLEVESFLLAAISEPRCSTYVEEFATRDAVRNDCFKRFDTGQSGQTGLSSSSELGTSAPSGCGSLSKSFGKTWKYSDVDDDTKVDHTPLSTSVPEQKTMSPEFFPPKKLTVEIVGWHYSKIDDPNSHIEYIIVTNVPEDPMPKRVSRRFRDFDALRNALKAKFPGFRFCKLPTKRLMLKSVEAIGHRQMKLQKFLRSLISHPLIRDVPEVHEFLKI